MQSTNFLRNICAVFAVLVGIAALVAVSSGASSKGLLQDATPFVPDPSECTIAPRPIPSPPSATPSIGGTLPPPGPIVPSNTRAEIEAVVRGSIACTNAGDILRALAYFTDEYVAQMFTQPGGVDYEGFLQYLATPVAPLDESQRVAIIEISEIRLIKTGLISALVVSGDPENPFEDQLIFVNVDGMWLIAGWGPTSTVYATPSP